MTDKKIIFHERMRIYMKYINENELSSSSKLRFGDIDSEYSKLYCDVFVSYWIHRTLSNDSEFLNELHLYKDIYPIAYLKVNNILSARKNKLDDYDRILTLMKYLEFEENVVPSGRSKLLFSDIGQDILDHTNVGIWIQDQIHKNVSYFISLYTNYKDIYPIAYQKLNLKIKKRDKNEILEDRVIALVHFLNKYSLVNKNRFSDIGGDKYDAVDAHDWVDKMLNINRENFLSLVHQYCFLYQLDEEMILNKILGNEVDKKQKMTLKERRKVELLMIYLEEHSIPSQKDSASFRDIDPSIRDDAMIGLWFVRSCLYNFDLFFQELESYKDYYPVAYDKIMKRKKTYLNRKKSKSIDLSSKVKGLMKYLEYHEINSLGNSSFSDIDEDINCSIIVSTWINNQINQNFRNFVNELVHYKDIYPTAYQKLDMRINKFNKRVYSERLLLIDELKKIRDYVEKQDNTMVKKLRK